MKNLILIGAGDWGLEVWAWLEHAKGYGNEFQFKGFLDSNPNALDKYGYCDAKILGNEHEYIPQPDDVFVCTIANTTIKESVTSVILHKGGAFINLIHDSVILFKNIKFGKGVVIAPNCVISNSCVIGNHVTVNLATTLGHDVEIGNYSQINSHCDITGHVKIGEKVFMGTSVCIIPKVKVAESVSIGAGSVVLKNLKANKAYFGNPAKEIL